MRRKQGQNKGKTNRITSVGITTDTLTSRGGLSLFGRYVEGIGICPTFERLFGSMRKNGKGQTIGEICKQVLCFFVDAVFRGGSCSVNGDYCRSAYRYYAPDIVYDLTGFRVVRRGSLS